MIGGLLFARPMRDRGLTTMLDPLEARYGRRMAAALYVPALAGELFWSAAILTALGTTFGTVVGLDFNTSIVVSAAVVITYTLVGGLWAVAVTDAVQMVILVVGLWLVVPFAAETVGGLGAAWESYRAITAETLRLAPPLGGWSDPAWGNTYWVWWDTALLLVFGGIPWHVYFQRVLASRDSDTAVRLSLLAAPICLLAATPAVLLGVIGTAADWQALGAPAPQGAVILPWVLRYLTNPWIASIGLGALAAAVMPSADSSILSASSMAAWNVYRPLRCPAASEAQLLRVVRRCIVLVGSAATLIALQVQSVYALWVLCSDFVYCILFPQLVTALFCRRANRAGAAAGLAVSLLLRFGGGEPALGLAGFLPYPMTDPASGVSAFPFRTTTMIAALATIVLVSRLTQRRYPPRPLPDAEATPTGTG